MNEADLARLSQPMLAEQELATNRGAVRYASSERIEVLLLVDAIRDSVDDVLNCRE